MINAALHRLSVPRNEEDEFSSFGKTIGFELKSINRQNALQAIIAKKLMYEIVFLASTNKLSTDSHIVNVAHNEFNFN